MQKILRPYYPTLIFALIYSVLKLNFTSEWGVDESLRCNVQCRSMKHRVWDLGKQEHDLGRATFYEHFQLVQFN